MYRSPQYLSFIRSKSCIICGSPDTVPHHEPLKQAGKGIKAPDSMSLPLCRRHHLDRHAKGCDTFWEGYDVKMLIIKYLTEYLEVVEI